MKKNGKQVLFLGGIFIIAFAIWTALIQMVDVQSRGAECNEYWICNIQLLVSSFNKC